MFEYFSDFLRAVSSVMVRTEVKEKDILEEDREIQDAPGVLIYNSNILFLPYSAEHQTIPDHKDSDEDDERALRILKIIETVGATPLISNIELPTLSGAIGSDYGGSDSIGANGNYYERMIGKKLAETLSKRNDFSLSFEIYVLGGRLFQTCRFAKEMGGNVNVYHADQSNCCNPLEFSCGPFHSLDSDEVQYTIYPGKVVEYARFDDHDDDDDYDEGKREREVVGGSLSDAVDAAVSPSDKHERYVVAEDIEREREVIAEGGIAERLRKRRRSDDDDAKETAGLKRQKEARDTALQAGDMPNLSPSKRKRSVAVLGGQSSNQHQKKKLRH